MSQGKPRPINGGVDHGKMWQELSIPPEAKPEEAADALHDCFDEQWCRELIEKLTERMAIH